jgi:putative DNA primase/helicase
MINLLTGETAEFSSSFMCTTQIPVIYDYHLGTAEIADFFRLAEDRRDDPEGRGRIIKFLYEVVTPEDVETILDFMAYCLWRAYRFNFWLLFHGAGFNGKSILLTLIERFLGKENVSGETLDRLLHERFAVGNLFNKMANIDADVSADVIFNNTGIIKKLTGNDLHTGEFKYKDPFKFVNYAKLIFSCNKIPDTDDKTDAFFRRVLIINFTQQFFGDKDDPYLIEKLCTNEEFTILLQHELLPRLRRIMREGGLKKVTNERLEETYDRYTRGSDPVRYFLQKATTQAPGEKVSKLEVYEHYHKFCSIYGLAPESDYSFSRKLSDDHHMKYKRGRLNGDIVYFWIDMKLIDWKQVEEEALRNLEDYGGEFSPEQKVALR